MFGDRCLYVTGQGGEIRIGPAKSCTEKAQCRVTFVGYGGFPVLEILCQSHAEHLARYMRKLGVDVLIGEYTNMKERVV